MLIKPLVSMSSELGELFSVLERVASSAYVIKSNLSLDCSTSLMYIINSNGPSIDPCGTPVFIYKISDLVLPT